MGLRESDGISVSPRQNLYFFLVIGFLIPRRIRKRNFKRFSRTNDPKDDLVYVWPVAISASQNGWVEQDVVERLR